MKHHSAAPLDFWKPFLRELHQDCSAQDIDLKVRHRDRTLHLLLEKPTILSRKQWVKHLQERLTNRLKTLEDFPSQDGEPIEHILIYGRITGQRYPSWKVVLELSSLLSEQSARTQGSTPATTTATTPSLAEAKPINLSRLGSALVSNPVPPPQEEKASSIRPAAIGIKDLLPQSLRDRLPLSAPLTHPQQPWDTAELGSQGWLARSVLGLFALALGIYLYVGTWFIPQQIKFLNALQPEVSRLEAAEPQNLRELTSLTADLAQVIQDLKRISPLTGIFYQRAQAQVIPLSDRYDRLQTRLDLEQQGQTYLSQAKSLAAQATSRQERSLPTSSAEVQREIQQKWLAANYWLMLIPGQTFAAQEAQRIQSLYHHNYWNTQAAQPSPVSAINKRR